MMKGPVYIFFLIGILISSCHGKNSQKIDKLVIGFTAGDDPKENMQNHNLIADYIKKETGVSKVECFMSTDYAAVIESMRAKKIDIAYLGEMSYILAAERASAEAIIMVADTKGRKLTSSIIITSPKSGLKNMNDVKRRAKDLSLTFADPASTSGHLYPRNYLISIGLDPEKSFKSVSFASNHPASIYTAVSGKTDIACTFRLAVERLIRKKRLKREDFVILWESGSYVATPICVRGDLPQSMKDKIKKAYLELPSKAPETWKKYREVAYIYYPEEVRKDLVYVPCYDSLYNGIRDIARKTPNFNFQK
jgi:phosphonate transport system substrate-binding protein